MPYKFFKNVRRVDADTFNIYEGDNTIALQVDTATANTTKLLGQTATTKILMIYPNQTDTLPYLKMLGTGNVTIAVPNAGSFEIINSGTSALTIGGYDGTDVKIIGAIADKNIAITPSGTGKLKFGSYSAGAAADSTGYISILDSAGNARKLMVQA